MAYQQLLYEMKYYSRPNAIHRDALYTPKMNDKVDLISDITTEDIQAFANKLFQSIAIEGAAYGTVNKKDLKNAVKSYTLIPGQTSTALPETSRPLETTYRFEKGKPLAITLSSENNNNCWGESLQFGARDPKLNAVIRIGQAQLGTSFFTNLRTKQQLGYVVYSGLNYHEKVLGLLYLIQSTTHDSPDIAQRVNRWRNEALEELRSLTPETFEILRDSVISELLEKDKTMGARLDRLFFEAFVVGEQFGYRQKIADAAKALNKSDVVATFENAFKERASLNVYLSSGNVADLNISEQLIRDKATYKEKSARY